MYLYIEALKYIFVEVVDGNKISKSIFDKKNNTLALEVKSGDIVIQKEFIDMNNTKEEDNEENINHNTRVRRAARSVTKKCIYSKLRYSINMKSWTITNSKGRVKKRPETKSHKEYLYKFKSAVDASRKHEIDARLGINTASISVVTGAITAVSGVGAAIAVISALGGTTAAGYSIWYSIEEKREADRYFAIL